MDATIIILGVVVVILLYYLYFFLLRSNTIPQKVDLNAGKVSTPEDKLPDGGSSSSVSYETWVFINNYPTKTPTTATEMVTLLKQGNLEVALSYNNPTLFVKTTEDTIKVTDNFPIQSWTQVIVSIDNGKLVDVYINGKLVISKSLSSQIGNTGSIELGSDAKPDISLNKTNRYLFVMDPRRAQDLYFSTASMGSKWNNYNVRVQLLKNENVNNELSLV